MPKPGKNYEEKIMDICLMCATEPNKECLEEHKDWVMPVFPSNILTETEWKKYQKELNGEKKNESK